MLGISNCLARFSYMYHYASSIFSQRTLLHMAAQARDVSVLPTVVQAYRKAGLLATALRTQGECGATPLHIAVMYCSYENTLLLLKECQEHCPDALTATFDGTCSCLSDIPMVEVGLQHSIIYLSLQNPHFYIWLCHQKGFP